MLTWAILRYPEFSEAVVLDSHIRMAIDYGLVL